MSRGADSAIPDHGWHSSGVVSDSVAGALIAAAAVIVGALIAASAGLFANWASQKWNRQERSAERREVRRVALLTQRTADLRELGDLLTEMVTAAKEIIWERLTTDKPMPKSDPRTMRLTFLVHRSRFLREVVGDSELQVLVRNVSSAASQLSDSNAHDVDKDTASTNQALAAALAKVASLLREADLTD